MKFERYTVGFTLVATNDPIKADALMDIDCRDCKATVFQIRDGRTFNFDDQYFAMLLHENTWHEDVKSVS